MGTLISSNALADSARRVLFLKRRYDLDIRSGLNGMHLIRMTVDSRVLGHPQSRQTNPNRDPSRAPTGLNPPPSPSTPLYWERRLISS